MQMSLKFAVYVVGLVGYMFGSWYGIIIFFSQVKLWTEEAGIFGYREQEMIEGVSFFSAVTAAVLLAGVAHMVWMNWYNGTETTETATDTDGSNTI